MRGTPSGDPGAHVWAPGANQEGQTPPGALFNVRFSTRVLDADDAEQSSCRQLADRNAARRKRISLN